MREVIERILPLWGIEKGEILQIYSSAWEINHSHVLKVYKDRKQLERNIKILTILSDCNVPVAKIVSTRAGEKYIGHEKAYFLMSGKLEGSSVSDIKNTGPAREMGRAIALLHRAFRECEKEVEFGDASLLEEMKGWIYDNLNNNKWQAVGHAEYEKTVEQLGKVYDSLPKQLIQAMALCRLFTLSSVQAFSRQGKPAMDEKNREAKYAAWKKAVAMACQHTKN